MNKNTENTNTRHALIARTRRGNFRVGGLSHWKHAVSRWSVATADGRSTRVTVRAYLDGSWVDLDGDLCVRGADDPMVVNATPANNPKLVGTDRVTVRASDYRKVR